MRHRRDIQRLPAPPPAGSVCQCAAGHGAASGHRRYHGQQWAPWSPAGPEPFRFAGRQKLGINAQAQSPQPGASFSLSVFPVHGQKRKAQKGVGTTGLAFAVLMTGMTAMSSCAVCRTRWLVHQPVYPSLTLLVLLSGAVVTVSSRAPQAPCWYPAGTERHWCHHLRQCHPHHHHGPGTSAPVTAPTLPLWVPTRTSAPQPPAMVHLYFNIIGVTLFLVTFYGANLLLDLPLSMRQSLPGVLPCGPPIFQPDLHCCSAVPCGKWLVLAISPFRTTPKELPLTWNL